MTNYNIKARLAMLGMKSMELAEILSNTITEYTVSVKDLSTAINWKGRQTDKQRKICETADRILREKEKENT